MRDIDSLFLEQMENDRFQSAMNDNFSFVDSLIDKSDLDKINKEDE